ncbi:MAG TPA: cytochrome D1 domain-containing protein [Pyrinomonadaceae bacterium]|nr:cytochrome D1 domain-containing protein [Pyrinomonadaceae bacterium]
MYKPTLLLLSLLVVQVSAQDVGQSPKPSQTPEAVTDQGVSIEFRVSPIKRKVMNSSGLIAGEEANISFNITGTNGAVPLSNLRPAVWIDQRPGKDRSDLKECRDKIQTFLQSSLSRRPILDLNSYFVLTLNQEGNISVIDPLSGFGGSKLYNLIALPGPGEDWVLQTQENRLYVSIPAVNQIAVIETTTWKTLGNIDTGMKPGRVALQHDGKYLWVGNEGGVTVIDTTTLKVAAQIPTGAGNHEIVFSDDDRFAFVTNKQDGTLTIVDTRKLARVKDLKVGPQPIAVALSSLSNALYVANEEDGSIAVVDPVRLEILTRLKTSPGLKALRLQPDGPYGFVLNPGLNSVFVFDLPSNKLVHKITVGPGADQITFTKQFAYVRSTASEFVTMIKLTDLAKEAALSRFPAGQKAPKEAEVSSLAEAIVPAPEEGAVLVANPADKMIYYYSEGMAAPMGSFQNYRRIPKALLVLDNGLRETKRGLYSTTIRLDAPGYYDAVFLLDSPRAIHCFSFAVDENPALPKPTATALKVQQLTSESPLVGKSYTLRFKLIDGAGEPKSNLNDLGVLVFLAPGIWQERVAAKPIGAGVYEMSFTPPQAGVYYVHFRIPSLDVPFSQITPLVLETKKS